MARPPREITAREITYRQEGDLGIIQVIFDAPDIQILTKYGELHINVPADTEIYDNRRPPKEGSD